MPRTRYTRLIHDRDEVCLAQQIRATRRLARDLRHRPAEVIELPVVVDLKLHRRARLEQKRRYKPTPIVITASA